MADPEHKHEARAPVESAGSARPAPAQTTDQDNYRDGEGEAEEVGQREKVPLMARSLSGDFTQRQRALTLRNEEADTSILDAAPAAEQTQRGRANSGGLASRWAAPPIPAFVARDGSTHTTASNVEVDVTELATASVSPPRKRRRGRKGQSRAHRRRESAPPAEPRGCVTSGALAASRWSSAPRQLPPRHNEDAKHDFNPLGRHISDARMNQAPLPDWQETKASAPEILKVPDVGTQTDPPPPPKTKSWAEEMDEVSEGRTFTPISTYSAPQPPQIVLGRGGMITPPTVRRYEPVIPSSSSQHFKDDRPPISGMATGTLSFPPALRKKDGLWDHRPAMMEDPYSSFEMRDHYTAHRGKLGASNPESTAIENPKRAFEGGYHAPTKGAPWKSLSRQQTKAPGKDSGKNNIHIPDGQASRVQSSHVSGAGIEEKKDDEDMSLSEAKTLIDSSNARDWVQKIGPLSKNGQVATRKLADPLDMPGRSYAEAHQHKKWQPERLKEKWVAKIAGKGKDKAVVVTVFVAEKVSARESKNENRPGPSTSSNASRDDSEVKASVKDERPVAESVTVRPSQETDLSWRGRPSNPPQLVTY